MKAEAAQPGNDTRDTDPYRMHVVVIPVVAWVTIPLIIASWILFNPGPRPGPWAEHAAQLGVQPIDLAAGEHFFQRTCAVCHGADGTGGGLSTGASGSHRLDLTNLSQRNGGVFPTGYVTSTIDGSGRVEAHAGDMPLWGKKFENLLGSGSGDPRAEAKAWIRSLVEYLQTIQR